MRYTDQQHSSNVNLHNRRCQRQNGFIKFRILHFFNILIALLNCFFLLALADPESLLEPPTNLRVFQRTAPDNEHFNIGVIQVKLKNWTTTTRLPLNESQIGAENAEGNGTLAKPRKQLKWRRNNEQQRSGEKRGQTGNDGDGGAKNSAGGLLSGAEMDGLFPYLLLALGLALVAFFVILYAILNALLQRRREDHQSEENGSRNKRKGRKRRRRKDQDLMERGEEGEEEDEEIRDEEEESNSIDEVDGTPPPLRTYTQNARKWHRPPRRDENYPEEEEPEWMGHPRRYRPNRTSTGRNSRNRQPLVAVPPPPREPPLRPGQRHARRRVEWAGDEDSLPGMVRLPMPPPPPPRVPPPPPPLPARYQKRRPRAPDPNGNDHQHQHRRNGRPRSSHKAGPADEFSDLTDNESLLQRRQAPPPLLRRENTDSTVSSIQRGRAGSL